MHGIRIEQVWGAVDTANGSNIMMMIIIKLNIESLFFIWTGSIKKCDTIVIMDKKKKKKKKRKER